MKLDEEAKESLRHWCCCCFCDCHHGLGGQGHYAPPRDVVNNAWWCCYCLIGGCGIGPCPTPVIGWVCKQGCIRGTLEMCVPCYDRSGVGNNGEGCCTLFNRCGCCTEQCACPPAPDSPKCVCFGCNCDRRLCTECNRACRDYFWCRLNCCNPDPCWCCYCCCGGCGVHEVMGGGASLYQSLTKCCCCRSSCRSADPTDREGCCMSVFLCCCWYIQCQIPPHVDNPVCSCCNRCGKPGMPACAAPQQEAMETTYGNSM